MKNISAFLAHVVLVAAVSLLLVGTARAAISVDATALGNQGTAKTTVTTASFSTTAANELLLAFVSADQVSSSATSVTNIAGAGVTWVLVKRTNTQKGTAEIWRAFAPSALVGVKVTATLSQSVCSSITVMSFAGVDTSGTNGSGAIGAVGTGNANPGLPSASLVTTRNGSLVLGVGNDWDNAIGRAIGAGQTLVHQYFPPVGDTYWVQMQTNSVILSGTTVTINDTAPAGDQFNISIVEVLAAAGGSSGFTVSGTINPSSAGTGTTVTLSQNGATVATTSGTASGIYSFSNIANGTYTVTPTNSADTFNPTSQSVTVSGNNATVPVFDATTVGFTVSGTINPTSAGTGTTVTLSQNGTTEATTSANSAGTYSFSNIPNGTYSAVPSNGAFSFNPASQPVTVSGGNATIPAFNATAATTFPVSGSINPSAAGIGTTVTLSQNGTTVSTATVTSGGIYNFANIANGIYTVTPANNAYSFSPNMQSIVVNGTTVVPAFAASSTVPLLFPDLQIVLPTDKMSIAQTATGRQFQYTHDVLNAGPGPLVMQPVFNAASGSYQGTQYIYSQNSSGKWSLIQQLPVAGAFIFDTDHHHFHFPFGSFGLYAVSANGGPGALVALSPKLGFCINDAFIFLPNIPNAGQLGNLGSCSDPTTLRGLDIGAVDEYDQTDIGQSIPIDNLPDGTYWFRVIADPENFLAEADKTNNETDVELTIAGTTLQVLKTVVPVINNPPSVSLTSPLNGATISRAVQLTASTATTSSVQYVIDGQPFGNVVSTPPYSVLWDTTTMSDGKHWLAAQTTDLTGVIGTSPVALVTVSNASAAGPLVQLTSPANGSILSAIDSVYAQVGSSFPIQSVSFFADSVEIGSPVTAPPYSITWDTTTVPDGQHTIMVSATDSQGHVGNSAPVTVTVNNSHPANLIGVDVRISVDGFDNITTPLFSTAVPGDLLIAFVSYDGPSNAPQAANVSGAGVSWTLLERSNTQAGTAEIWSARADGLLNNVSITAVQEAATTFHGSLTVIAFTNAAGTSVVGRTGTLTGAPDIPLPGVVAGDWVFAVGNDWDDAIARVPVSGQALVHQRVDTVIGDTYWVQSTTAPSSANALVDIHDSSPTTDRWNYAAVEVVATHQ